MSESDNELDRATVRLGDWVDSGSRTWLGSFQLMEPPGARAGRTPCRQLCFS